MTIIEASSGTYRSRVDGTIVLSVEIEPRFRAEALALFGMPGTPMALAALKCGAQPETEANPPVEVTAPKVGPLAKWAAIRCTEPSFQRWLTEMAGWHDLGDEEDCAEYIRIACGVESRKELDTDAMAARAFHKSIREPYAAWLKQQGIGA